jgi:hypothetical protein
MVLRIFLLAFLLTGCAQHAVPAEGAVLHGIPAQAVEQCKAQPDSAWCKP